MTNAAKPPLYTRRVSQYSSSASGNTASAQLSSYLSSGELLLWSGRPDPAVRFASSDAYLIPFSIMWAGFAFFWESSVFRSGAPIFFRLWGIPFMAIGLYIVFGRFFVKARRKRTTAYGITKDRALISTGPSGVTDVPIRSTATTISKSRDGSHVSVVFGQGYGTQMSGMYFNTGMGSFSRGRAPVFGFYDVADTQGLLSALDQAKTGT